MINKKILKQFADWFNKPSRNKEAGFYSELECAYPYSYLEEAYIAGWKASKQDEKRRSLIQERG